MPVLEVSLSLAVFALIGFSFRLYSVVTTEEYTFVVVAVSTVALLSSDFKVRAVALELPCLALGGYLVIKVRAYSDPYPCSPG